MFVQLVALDLDGTTLQEDHCTVSEGNRRAIQTVIDRGIFVVPATGRALSEIPPDVRSISGIRYVITSNGACVSDVVSGGAVFQKCIEPSVAAAVFRAFSTMSVYSEVFCDGRVYVERESWKRYLEGIPPQLRRFMAQRKIVDRLAERIGELGRPVEKITVIPHSEEDQRVIRDRLAGIPVQVTTSGMNSMEISGFGVHKGNALAHLCEFLRIDRQKVLAMGDQYNDLEMLRFAGVAVAPGNAVPDVLQTVDWVAPENYRDGVAAALERFAESPDADETGSPAV